MRPLALVIPAYKPASSLAAVVRGVDAIDRGVLFPTVVVVDDGSGEPYREMFDALGGRCEIVRLEPNRGKGAALKAGFARALEDAAIAGVVTADADGQHRPDDIIRVGQALVESGDVVLGVRRFTSEVPLRSRFGNVLTRGIVSAFAGRRFSDTQTGLRGLPRELAAAAIALEGDRYEYELAMLLSIPAGQRIVEVPIATVYEEGNRSSHFRPLADSARIYGVLARRLIRGGRRPAR